MLPSRSFASMPFRPTELLKYRDGINGALQKRILKTFVPIDAFGIVAAVCAPSKNSDANGRLIIGVNGQLPWNSLPSDRIIFERLTGDRILIVGRRTLLDEGEGTFNHVCHAKYCIVVSKSISRLDECSRIVQNKLAGKDSNFLKLVSSLDEALNLARVLSTELHGNEDSERMNRKQQKFAMDIIESKNFENMNDLESTLSSASNIQCWVAGGERLYEEALQHQSALQLHLSVVDLEIDISSKDIRHVAMFPSKDHWAGDFELFNKTRFPPASKSKGKKDYEFVPSFSYHVYRRAV